MERRGPKLQIPKKYQKALGNVISVIVVSFLFLFLVPKILLMFMPFIAGRCLAWLANPVVSFLEDKLKIKRKIGSAFVMIGVIAGIVFLFYMFGRSLMREGILFLKKIPDLWQQMRIEFMAVTGEWPLGGEKLPGEVLGKMQEMTQILGDKANVIMG